MWHNFTFLKIFSNKKLNQTHTNIGNYSIFFAHIVDEFTDQFVHTGRDNTKKASIGHRHRRRAAGFIGAAGTVRVVGFPLIETFEEPNILF